VRILAIETATAASAVAIAGDEGVLAMTEVRSGRRHVEHLHPEIARCAELAEVALASLDGVVVDVGPGRFAGLRVGVAAGRGLCQALSIPGVGIESCTVLTEAVAIAGRPTAALIDLRRGRVAYQLSVPGRERGAISAGSPAEMAEQLLEWFSALERDASSGDQVGTQRWAAAPVLVIGDGACQYRQAIEQAIDHRLPVVFGDAMLAVPPVSVLAALGLAALGEQEGANPGEPGERDRRTALRLVPRYLSEPDVAISWQTRDVVDEGHGDLEASMAVPFRDGRAPVS
jgi:tRNA threonylcarbamoyl adenosine modification protein YeaZ